MDEILDYCFSVVLSFGLILILCDLVMMAAFVTGDKIIQQ